MYQVTVENTEEHQGKMRACQSMMALVTPEDDSVIFTISSKSISMHCTKKPHDYRHRETVAQRRTDDTVVAERALCFVCGIAVGPFRLDESMLADLTVTVESYVYEVAIIITNRHGASIHFTLGEHFYCGVAPFYYYGQCHDNVFADFLTAALTRFPAVARLYAVKRIMNDMRVDAYFELSVDKSSDDRRIIAYHNARIVLYSTGNVELRFKLLTQTKPDGKEVMACMTIPLSTADAGNIVTEIVEAYIAHRRACCEDDCKPHVVKRQKLAEEMAPIDAAITRITVANDRNIEDCVKMQKNLELWLKPLVLSC